MWSRHGAFTSEDDNVQETEENVAINWDAASDTGDLFPFLALGGDVRAAAGFSQFPDSSGLTISGLSFEPQLVIYAHNGWGTGTHTPGGIGEGYATAYGAFDDAGNGFQVLGTGIYLDNSEPNSKIFRSGGPFYYDLQDGTVWVCDTRSFNSDGFDLTVTSGDPTDEWIAWLAIRCESEAPRCGIYIAPTSTGLDQISLPWRPSGLLTMSVGSPNNDTVEDDYNIMLGVASSSPVASSSEGWVVQWVHPPGQDSRAQMQQGPVISFLDDDNGWGIKAEATVDSWDSDGVTLDWTTADSTARRVGYVAFPETQEDVGDQPVALVGVQSCERTTETSGNDQPGILAMGLHASGDTPSTVGIVDPALNRNQSVILFHGAAAGQHPAGTYVDVLKSYTVDDGEFVPAPPDFVPVIYRYSVDNR